MNSAKAVIGSFDYYEWLSRLAWTRKAGLAVVFAGLTGICAQIRIVLPWTPVPVTGQVFAVLLSGILLGHYGALSMACYFILGLAGVPWFSTGSAAAIGPTTGYIIGFIPAALFVAAAFRRQHNFLRQTATLSLAVAIIYLCGAVHFTLFTRAAFDRVLVMTVAPFIPFDIVKGIIAAGIGRLLTANTIRRT